MLYKITNIKHSGRKGTRGENRTDGRYPLRVGRIIDVGWKTLNIGESWVIHYITDENNEPYDKYFITSRVIDIKYEGDFKIYVETMNSIYEITAISAT